MRFDLPQDKRFVFEMRIPIRWGDMDAYGHVNNTVYFRFLESARVDWLEAVKQRTGSDLGAVQGMGPVVVNAFCTFHRQLEYPGDVIARQYVGQIGRSSIETYTTLARADAPDVICASGGGKVVWVNFAAQVAVALPQDLVDHLVVD